MDDQLAAMLKYLRLPGLLAHWDQLLKNASRKNMSHVRMLKSVIEAEYAVRRENSRQRRIRCARIPNEYVIETYPFSRQPKLNKKRVLSLHDSFDYMEKRQNVIFVGPTGVGKTGLATSLLTHALNAGHSGRYILFPELIDILYTSIADHSQRKVIKTFSAYDCLVIDEIGYVEIEPVQAGLFFNLMHKRHGKKTTLVTTNLGFSEWSSFLKNDHLTAALIDRLTENSHVINMKNCVSLRPRLKQT